MTHDSAKKLREHQDAIKAWEIEAGSKAWPIPFTTHQELGRPWWEEDPKAYLAWLNKSGN